MIGVIINARIIPAVMKLRPPATGGPRMWPMSGSSPIESATVSYFGATHVEKTKTPHNP